MAPKDSFGAAKPLEIRRRNFDLLITLCSQIASNLGHPADFGFSTINVARDRDFEYVVAFTPSREFVAGEPFVYIFTCVDALPQVEIGPKAPNRPASRFPSLRMDWIAAAMTGSELKIDPLPPPEEGVSLKAFKESLAWQKRAMLEYCSDFLASREPTMWIETDKRLAKYN